MRHAKSSWANLGQGDYERPLNARGENDAPRMGRWLSQQNKVPDLIVSSTAKRARQTAELLAENLDGFDRTCLEWADDLYHAAASVYLRKLDDLAHANNESIERVLFVGHNPGLEELLQKLSGEYHFMPTATIAWFENLAREPVETDIFQSIEPTLFRLQRVWRPKEILKDSL